ncbi:ABC transporter ATP-binding protein [Actinoallomurus rhizosphaericola]|uniref:ABC transporter ATP-binding protein n=1 Tax=Actinoallomurus rhizosphaericola TaxID=2952536 RepID=UPI002091B703|nr:ABC transporter ATP-binding protein [Actinoallomurus rhizosphaericola]MCO5994570.1 ABC transporter ATP-binding protein/permease [Actinoallomurus rhizosphaericola]
MRPVPTVMAGLARSSGLGRYVLGALLWLPTYLFPIGGGLLLKEVFDRLSGDRAAGLPGALWLCAAFVGLEVVRGLNLVTAWAYGVYWWEAAATTLRVNVLRSVLTARGAAAARLPYSSGEALARLRDDVSDLVQVTDDLVDLTGTVLFGVTALVIMATVDPAITLALVLPMIAVGVLSRLLGTAIRRLHRRARRLGAVVTAHVGDAFAGILAIKTAGAEDAVLARLRAHNRRRRNAAVRDRLATDLLDTVTSATVEIGMGIVLLIAAPAMHHGSFTVGDLALFTGYLGWLTALPRSLGTFLYRLPQAAVAAERLGRLMAPHEDVHDLARVSGVWFRRDPPPVQAPPHPDPLEVVEGRGLTVRYGGGRGLDAVDLRIERGSFTVITGAVGAGKTTLVRALLGLVPLDAGTVSWNGRPVDDPGTYLVPGRVAYASQIPRLFSDSLRENLLLGADGERLATAIELAAFDADVAAMPDGLETVVGPRGVRLSGGQVQRATAARALVRAPDLLVVDDLSSALDVETERLLWERIADAARDGRGPATLLVVSHRRAALERADRVVVLDRGRVVGQGRLGELLEDCAEMRRLWTGELLAEAEEQADTTVQ